MLFAVFKMKFQFIVEAGRGKEWGEKKKKKSPTEVSRCVTHTVPERCRWGRVSSVMGQEGLSAAMQ